MTTAVAGAGASPTAAPDRLPAVLPAARRWRRVGPLGGLTVVLAATILVSAGVGAVPIRPLQALAMLADRAGLHLGVAYSAQQDAVLWAIRLPRVVLGTVVGAGLGLSGAALQGVFRNPLADPGLIGVSSGAALGAVAAIVLGLGAVGAATLPVAAFAGGLAATLAVYALARRDGRTEVVTLVLTGVAVNAIVGAGIGLLTLLADDQQLRSLVFWSLGSLGSATWPAVAASAPLVALGLVLIPRFAVSLNLLVLGEREAFHLGVHPERVRMALVALCALTTGAAVAAAGIVGFVGLVVPHLVRLAWGPDHRLALPASALGGAIAVVVADLLARTAAAPTEVPLGVVTGAAGGPFFLWLLHRTRRAQGGWG
ncbi:MAG TPA: iron ABC transporter permease [Acidimicrobiales bacterium]|nr:iron ABC transporter permease [Acidimicrobiales bacterium]